MIYSDKVKILDKFVHLQEATLQAISERAFEKDFNSSQTFVIEGMPAELCYFLLSGKVRVLRMSREGRQQVLARFGPGAPLNIISLLHPDAVNQASIEALTPVKVLVLDASDFTKLLSTYPDFSSTLLKIFAERMAKITDLAASLSLYTVRSRLALFLMELADHPASGSSWTQDEIAAQIGTVRDVVGRLLRDFEAEGLIARDRHQIKLLNREKLILEANQDDF